VHARVEAVVPAHGVPVEARVRSSRFRVGLGRDAPHRVRARRRRRRFPRVPSASRGRDRGARWSGRGRALVDRLRAEISIERPCDKESVRQRDVARSRRRRARLVPATRPSGAIPPRYRPRVRGAESAMSPRVPRARSSAPRWRQRAAGHVPRPIDRPEKSRSVFAPPHVSRGVVMTNCPYASSSRASVETEYLPTPAQTKDSEPVLTVETIFVPVIHNISIRA
jgi:hypothetical protein